MNIKRSQLVTKGYLPKVLIGALRAGLLTWLEFLEEWRKS